MGLAGGRVGLAARGEEYLRWLEGVGAAPATIRNRRRAVAGFAEWVARQGIAEPRALTLSVVEGFQLDLARRRRADSSPLAVGTQSLYLTAIRHFCRWLLRNGLLEQDATDGLRLPRRPARLPSVVLSAADAETVLAQPNAESLLGLRDRAILETLYSTGMRRQELVQLRVSDLDRERGVVLIREGKGRRDRVVPIGARAIGWIDRYLRMVRPRWLREPDAGSLFLTSRGNPLYGPRLSDRVRRYLREAGVAQSGSCHVFRHTMATLLLENGADIRVVQEILGHASLATTALYTHVAIGRIKLVHSATHPAERGARQGPTET